MKNSEIVKKGLDVMRVLEDQIGQTIGLGALDAETADGVVLAEVEGTAGFAYHLSVNYHFPLHTAAPGKALLAYLPPAERSDFLNRMDFRRYTPSTITERSDFEEELKSVVEKSYAIDVSEQLEGCHCIGVPVFDPDRNVVASLWTTGPSSQLPIRSFEQVADILKRGARDLSVRLSGPGRASNRAYIHSAIQQAREIMATHLHEPVDVRQLAENLYVSYSWFRKNFKEQTGSPPAEYHQSLRLENARQQLLESERSIRQISEELGFKNQNHFSALFKQKTGKSPSAYRELHRPETPR